MNNVAGYLLQLIMLILTSQWSPAQEFYHISTEDTPPYSYEENGEVKGINVDTVRLIQKELGQKDSIRILPWARAYQYIQTKEKQIVFAMIKSPEREKLFKFACSFNTDEVYLVKKRGSPVSINSLKDARQYQVGVVRGWYQHQFLKYKGFRKLHTVNTELQTLAMLIKDRVDLIPYNIKLMDSLDKNYSMDPNSLENTGVKLYKTEYCIAFSRDIKDEVVSNWEKALKNIVQSGKFKEIQDRYLSQ